jgi:ADP-L-glycero-D-manno-heptose 6-epimerase
MILVTGGAGMIGSHVIEELNLRGYTDILVCDHFKESDHFLNLNSLKYVDCIDKSNLMARIQNYDIEVIFHLGACSSTTEKNTGYLLQNNFEYSKELFLFAEQKCIPFIYASSASVYGMGSFGFRESSECENPLNGYAWSKLLFDNWLRSRQNLQTRYIGLRYFNVFGSREQHKGRMASVIWQFSEQIKKEGHLSLFEGSEAFLRDFVWVNDVARITVDFWSQSQCSGIYNLGSGKTESFLKIAEWVTEYFGANPIQFVEFPQDLVGKYQKYTCADLSNVNQLDFALEWTPLEKAVKTYLEDWKK